tara:strand:+ start:2715 stop:6212 length:3498 start_codon:yes stop_codon:yes gene_type:complete
MCLIALSHNTLAQESKGDKLITELQFNKAIVAYEKALKKDTSNEQLYYKLAEANRKIKNYDRAVSYYDQISNLNAFPSQIHLHYGKVLMNTQHLNKAKVQFELYAQKNPNDLIAKQAVQSINNVKKWRTVKRPFRIDTLSGINTPYAEFCAVPFQKGIVFTSDREIDHYNDKSFNWTGNPYLSLYKSSRLSRDPKQFGYPEYFSNRIKSDYHDGPISFDKKQIKAFYTRVKNENSFKEYTNRMKIYSSRWNGKNWIDETDYSINSDNYSVGHPNYDVERDRLYFSSDMPGGFGGMDIYYIQKTKDGWSNPINLGKQINTSGNEVFPTTQGDKLYYSSNGISGYGGLDLFQSTILEEKHTTPINLKAPINSGADDFGMSFISNEEGYFSSNRPGGKGLDDIYYFQILDSAYADTAEITGIFEHNNLPVEGVKLNLKDNNGSVLEDVNTDGEGRFKFSALPTDQSYLVTLDEEDKARYSNSNIFLTNTIGEKVLLADRFENGSFKFRALPLDLLDQMDLIEEEDAVLNTVAVTSQVFNKVPGDISVPTMVYLFDKNGLILDSLMTDHEGKLVFRNLDVEKDYLIALQDEDPDTYFAIYNSSQRIASLPKKQEDGKVKLNKEEIVNLQLLEGKSSDQSVFVGKAELGAKSLSNLKLHLITLTGDTVATTFTNYKGEFEFEKLQTEDNYLIRISDENPDHYYESKLYAVNNSGSKLYLINRLKEGDFTFKALPFDKVEGLTPEMVYDDQVTIYGQVYKDTRGDFTDSTQVIIQDEKGKMVAKTFTNAQGRFKFTKLDPLKQYTFFLPTVDDGLTVILEDDKNQFLSNTVRIGKGKFKYSRLTADITLLDLMAEEDDNTLLLNGDKTIFGQVYRNKPNDYTKPVMVYLLDEDGSIVSGIMSDKLGRFKFHALAADDSYFFKIADVSDDLNLSLYSYNNEVISIAERLGKGLFKFNKLDLEKAKLTLAEVDDSDIYLLPYTKDDSVLNTEQTISENIEIEEVTKKEIVEDTMKDKVDEEKEQLPKTEKSTVVVQGKNIDNKENTVTTKTNSQDMMDQFVIYYQYNSHEIDESETDKLNSLLDLLQTVETLNLEVISYADPVGPESYNYNLSNMRSNSVIDYFYKKGIDRSRFKGQGKGEINLLLIQDIVNSPLTKEENRINRRTEFKIYTD